MKQIRFENDRGSSLMIGNNSDFDLFSITGISPPTAFISTSKIAGFDGTTFINSSVNQRNITMTLQVNGNIEENRLKLYDIFKIKRKGTFYYHSARISAMIEAYVENIEVSPMDWPIRVFISLLCPKPYFEALNEIVADITSIDYHLEFPLELLQSGIEFGELQTSEPVNVINPGNIPIGMIIRYRATGTVVNPKLVNTQTLEFIELNTTMESGDVIAINTEVGQKRIERNRNGTITNLFNSLVTGSKFLQLNEGDNVLFGSSQSGSNSLFIEVEYRAKYSGV